MKKSLINFYLISVLFITLVIVSGCNRRISEGISKNNADTTFKSEEDRLDYYYAYTEATKQALLYNDYKQAILLYKECLKVRPISPAVFFQLSNIYMRLGNMNLATEYGREAVMYGDKNKWYLYHLANLYQMKNDIDSTIIVYEKLYNLFPEDPEYAYNLATLYYSAKKYKRSLDLVNTIEQKFGTADKIYILRYQIYSKTNELKKAENELQNLIKYYPENANNYGLMAEFYADENDTLKAEKYYKILFQKDENNPQGQISYAEFNRQIKNYKKACTYYGYAIGNDDLALDSKLNLITNLMKDDSFYKACNKQVGKFIDELSTDYPGDIRVKSLSVDNYIQSQNFNEAKKVLIGLVQKPINSPIFWEQLMYVENSLNEYDSLLHYSNEALNYYENDPSIYLSKAISLVQLNRSEEALLALKTGIQYVNSKDKNLEIQYYNLYAEAYRNVKNYDKSDEYFEKILKIDPKNLVVRNNYGYYLAERGIKLNRAEELSKLTIEKEPDNYTYLDTYGWILFQKGDVDKAKKYIEDALNKGGKTNGEILEHYGDILFKIGDKSNALLFWNQAIKYGNDKKELELKIKEAKAE